MRHVLEKRPDFGVLSLEFSRLLKKLLRLLNQHLMLALPFADVTRLNLLLLLHLTAVPRVRATAATLKPLLLTGIRTWVFRDHF